MNVSASVSLTALVLALSSVAFAQRPDPPRPPDPGDAPAPPQAASHLKPVTQSSRIRAFDAGPGGEVRSLYLEDGSVVDLTPSLAASIAPALRKGEEITVSGEGAEFKGQFGIQASSVRLDGRSFRASDPAPGPLARGVSPARPGGPQADPPAPARRGRTGTAAPAPRGAAIDGPAKPMAPDAPPAPPGFAAGPPPSSPPPSSPPPPHGGMQSPPAPPQN